MILIFENVKGQFVKAFEPVMVENPEFDNAALGSIVDNAFQFILSVQASDDNIDLINTSVEVFCYYLNEFSDYFGEEQAKFLIEFINYVIYEHSHTTVGYFIDATKSLRTW